MRHRRCRWIRRRRRGVCCRGGDAWAAGSAGQAGAAIVAAIVAAIAIASKPGAAAAAGHGQEGGAGIQHDEAATAAATAEIATRARAAGAADQDAQHLPGGEDDVAAGMRAEPAGLALAVRAALGAERVDAVGPGLPDCAAIDRAGEQEIPHADPRRRRQRPGRSQHRHAKRSRARDPYGGCRSRRIAERRHRHPLVWFSFVTASFRGICGFASNRRVQRARPACAVRSGATAAHHHAEAREAHPQQRQRGRLGCWHGRIGDSEDAGAAAGS